MSIDKVDNGYMIVLKNKSKHRADKSFAWYYMTVISLLTLIFGAIWQIVYHPTGKRHIVAEKIFASLWIVDISIIVGIGIWAV